MRTMAEILFCIPDAHVTILHELRKIPFVKEDDGYKFASWVYDLNNNEDKHAQLLDSTNGTQAAALIDNARKELEQIIVSEDDYLAWTVHKKDGGGVAKYHKIMNDLKINLLLLAIDMPAEDFDNITDYVDESYYYSISQGQTSSETKQVLNRNNPFADITIKSQQFFYKSSEGTTETLFFTTNNIIEKVDKGDENMLVMRPSFSVIKEHGVAKQPMMKVTFSNSMTEPIVADKDHIYIHID